MGNVVVEMPLPGTEPRQPKKKKNRPTGLKYNKRGATAKSAAKGGSAPASPEVTVLVQSLLQGVFAIGAGRMGEHWNITEDEAASIAGPAVNIMGRYLDTDTVAKYSDPAALLMALCLIVVPRATVTITKKKERQNNVRELKPVNPGGPNDGNGPKHGNTDNGKLDGDAGNAAAPDVGELLRSAEFSPY